MERFIKISSIAVPLLQANIDTDAIIPGDQLMRTETTGYGNGLFANWRFQKHANGDRTENPDFILNQAPYRQAKILLAGPNFACGSSREPAVWALRDWGFRCVIAPSFGEIFYANCFKNHMLPVILDFETVKAIARQVEAGHGDTKVTVDLEHGLVIAPDGQQFAIYINDYFRTVLLQGLDPVAAILQYDAAISRFQASDRKRRPWIYMDAKTTR
jgi:3-isopropylmalate/(R)-2-methylmalate dehydratase small subunit